MWWQEERRRQERQWRDEELEQHRRNRELDEVEEAQFQAYARDLIQHCEQRGRNTYPLRRAAASVAREVTRQRQKQHLGHFRPSANLSKPTRSSENHTWISSSKSIN